MKILTILFVLLLSGCFSACSINEYEDPISSHTSTLVERDFDAPIQTEFLSYLVEQKDSFFKVTLNISFLNTFYDEAFIPRCKDLSPLFSVEKLENKEWRNVYSSFCQIQGTDEEVAIKKGEVLQTQVSIEWFGNSQRNSLTLDTDSIPGVYRIVLNTSNVNPDRLDQDAPQEQKQKAVSNAFELMQKKPSV